MSVYWTNDAGDGSGGSGASPNNNEEKRFTQADLDRHITERLKREREAAKKEKDAILQQLQQIQTKGLSEEDRQALENQIKQLEEANMTVQEKAEQERKNLLKVHEKNVADLTSDRDTWKTRFHVSTIRQALTEAGLAQNVENVNQIIAMFAPSAYLEEQKDEKGKPLGTFITRMKFLGIDHDSETKAQKEFDLPVAEAMKKLREDGLNSNLFKHQGTGGTGRTPDGSGNGAADVGALDPIKFTSMEEYQEAYLRQREARQRESERK